MEGTADVSGGPPRGGAPGGGEQVVSLELPAEATAVGADLVAYRPPPATEQAIVSLTRLVLGAVDLAAAALATLLQRSAAEGDSPRGAAAGWGWPSRLPLAAVGLGLQAQRRGLQAAAAAQRHAAAAAVAITTRSVVLRRASGVVQRRLDDLNRRGVAEQHENRQAARDFLEVLVTELATAVLDRVDLDAVVGRVDLDAIVGRLDLDAIVDRLDLDAVAARLDLDAVVDRLDIPAVIRESTSTMTDETVEQLRIHGMTADKAVGRVVDRLLRRHSSPP